MTRSADRAAEPGHSFLGNVPPPRRPHIYRVCRLDMPIPTSLLTTRIAVPRTRDYQPHAESIFQPDEGATHRKRVSSPFPPAQIPGQ